MSTPVDIFEAGKQFLTQQAEIFGSEFILEWKHEPVSKAVPVASTLQDFQQKTEHCTLCSLADSRTNFVFGVGNPNANLMCIGEGPGYEEDKKGEPFVGPAGQLLNKILASVGFKREEVYIANIVKCRPPQNRDPLPEEAETCLPYLKRQIEFIQPKIILALGRVAAQYLLKSEKGLGALRGGIHDFPGAKVMVTYHPAALLRNQKWKRDTWEDVKRLRRLYDDIVGDKTPLQPN